jgi:hypothetical protein
VERLTALLVKLGALALVRRLRRLRRRRPGKHERPDHHA